MRGIGVIRIQHDILEVRGDIVLDQIRVNSDDSADLFDHIHYCLEFIDQLCIGNVRALLQPVHALIDQVHGEGVIILIHCLVSETLHHIK